MIRSAFNYLSQAGNQLLQLQASASSDAKSHPLLGQTLSIGDHSYVVRSLLAEGGYALVFAVEAVKNDRSSTNGGGGGQWYALKRLLAADREAADAVIREINFLKQLNGHPSIVRFCHATKQQRGAVGTTTTVTTTSTAAAKLGGIGGRLASSFIPSSSSSSASSSRHFCEFFVLTELCSGGPLIDLLRLGPLSVEQVCKILHATAQAINHMHDRNPPITHRDIKIENLLFDAHGHVKLCDFGSATTDIYRPCDEWSALVRAQLEEEIAKFTTPMYRAPEVLDTYQNFPIGPAQDVWALGCVLFYLCYRVHPFEDSAKLRILNANYKLPAQSEYQVFHELIRRTLQPDPYSRPSIQDLCEQIEELALALNVPLDEPVLSADQLLMLRDKHPTVTSTATTLASTTTTTTMATTTTRPITPVATTLVTKTTMPEMTTSSSSTGGALAPATSTKTATKCSRSGTPTEPAAANGATKYNDHLLLLQGISLISDDQQNNGAGEWEIGGGGGGGGGGGQLKSETEQECSVFRNGLLTLYNISMLGQMLFNFELPTKPKTTVTPTTCSNGTATGTVPMAAAVNDAISAGVTKRLQKGGDLEDILSAMYGFTSSTKTSNRSLADMVKETEAQLMDPLSIKIRDWTSGKERNIRALIGSLNAVLWTEAAQQWKQPTMAELFEAENVKKHYRRACLVVHPDKQMGTVHEPLAKAIFTELNDAWTEFQQPKH